MPEFDIVNCNISVIKLIFLHAAFYGETALRVFYGLDRFSEDIDFSLMTKCVNFSLSSYLPQLEKAVSAYGFEISAQEKVKHHTKNVQSAFLKGNTIVHLLKIFSLEPRYLEYQPMSL